MSVIPASGMWISDRWPPSRSITTMWAGHGGGPVPWNPAKMMARFAVDFIKAGGEPFVVRQRRFFEGRPRRDRLTFRCTRLPFSVRLQSVLETLLPFSGTSPCESTTWECRRCGNSATNKALFSRNAQLRMFHRAFAGHDLQIGVTRRGGRPRGPEPIEAQHNLSSWKLERNGTISGRTMCRRHAPEPPE